MSRLPLSLRVVALSAAAAVLVLPTAAHADEDNRAAQGQEHANPTPGVPQGETRSADPKASPNPNKPSDPGADTPRSEGNAGGNGRGNGAGATEDDNRDPAGNNGTIKIDYPSPADSGNATRPHPGCAFQLRMFNFDDDQYGELVITGQAPTDIGTLLTRRILLSSDAAGGGQDVDEVYSFTAADLGLTGTAPSQNGWHLKVAVDAEDAPGGAKQKVFWLDCPPVEVVTPPASSVVRPPARTTAALTLGEARVITSELTFESQSASKPTRLLFTGGGGILRGALPMTGVALTLLMGAAAAAIVLGGMAVASARRRSTAGL